MLRYPEIADSAARANHKERRDCTVIATALACNVPYDRAHRTLAAAGRKRGKGFHIEGAPLHQILGSFGYRAEKVDTPARTVRALPDALPHGTYLAFTRGHILAMVDGVVEDWTAGRRHQLQNVYRVLPQAAKPAPKPPAPTTKRAPAYPDHYRITVLNGNPCRPGSAVFDRFANYTAKYATVGEFIAAGGRRSDLRWHVTRGEITIG